MNETAKNQWNGEYPIFIEWKDQYEWTQFDIMHDEAQLIEFCDSHQLNPRELIYLNAQPIYACDGVFIDADELRFQGGSTLLTHTHSKSVISRSLQRVISDEEESELLGA
mgnify:CR=1 FL=1